MTDNKDISSDEMDYNILSPVPPNNVLTPKQKRSTDDRRVHHQPSSYCFGGIRRIDHHPTGHHSVHDHPADDPSAHDRPADHSARNRPADDPFAHDRPADNRPSAGNHLDDPTIARPTTSNENEEPARNMPRSQRYRGTRGGTRRQQERFVNFLYQLSSAHFHYRRRGRGNRK